MRSIPLEFGGKTRNLRFDYNAMCDLEELSGKTIDQLSGASSLRYLLWAGLKWEKNDLTLREVGEWIQDYLENGSMEELAEKCEKAVVASGLSGDKGNV